jgi:Domain of unknown function (DUF4272)
MSTESLPPDEVRDASQIARRAIALFRVVGIAFGDKRASTVAWIQKENLWDELTPAELAFVTASRPKKQQVVNASWRCEALLILLWALGRIDSLPALNEECSAASYKTILPPFVDTSVADFIATATRRTDDELIAAADSLLNSHWEARDARIHGRPIPEHLHIGIIQERHHAINWVIGYDGSPWDEITTDT